MPGHLNFGQRLLSLVSGLLLSGVVAASAEATETSPQEVTELSKDPAWLALGHWRKTWRGFKSDVDGLQFFLAPDGKQNPLSELRATIEAFRAPSEDAHAQCRFPARSAWLRGKIALPPAHCVENENWKQRFDADGVSVVFASAYMNNAASLFGHTFLKFHSRANGNGRDLLDYGVSFLAKTGEGEPFALYGLIGLYPGQFSLNPFHLTLKEYANLEGRDLWEYRLNLSPQEVDRLVDHLLELQQTYFDYYFIDENCSYQILALLEVARPGLELTKLFPVAVIPADTIRRLTRVPGLVTARKFRPSLMTTFRQSLEDLPGDQRNLPKDLLANRDLLSTSTRTIDAALEYEALLAQKNLSRFRDRAHELRLQRSKLQGPANAEASLAELTANAHGPEAGPDPARVGLSVGERDGGMFEELQTRAAYHHLLSDERGGLPNSQLEVLRFTFRRTEERLSVQEARLLDVISLSPSDRYFQPLAWRIDAGFSRLPDRPAQEAGAASLNGGVGYAAAPLKNLSAFTFLQAHADAGADLETNYRLGASLQAQALYRPVLPLALQLGGESRHYLVGAKSSFGSLWARGAYAVTQQWELRLEWQSTAIHQEADAYVFWHFIL